jgi:hypothetical protein
MQPNGPMQPPTQDWRARFERLPQGARVLLSLGVAAVVVICSCGLCGAVLNAANGATSTASAGSTSTTIVLASPTATARPKPTATFTPSGPRPITSSTIGGMEANFQAKYGAPSMNEKAVRHYDASINGTPVLIVVLLDPGTGGQRAGFLHLVTPDSGTVWSKSTATGIAKLFLPSDATYVKDRTIQDFGVEHVYMSADLAASFPASAFIDNDTNAPVKPGTFYYACGGEGETEGGCTVNLGQ